MSFLKEKSELNKTAAEFLSNNGHKLSVVHCAYYSCFQLLNFKFISVYGRNLKGEYDLYKKKNPESKAGSHDFAINEATNDLRKRFNYSEAQKFRDNMQGLKKLRHEADYGDIAIKLDYNTKSLILLNTIELVLNKIK